MMNYFRYIVFAILSIFFLNAHAQQNLQSSERTFDPSGSDPEALKVVDEMWLALGGKEAWAKNRYLSFRWLVGREDNVVANYRHDWDRHTARYRVEGTNREGQHFVVLFHTETKDGEVYIDGAKVEVDSTRQKMLENAYGRYINDSYWLIMPYKLQDPGVILNYEGEKEIAGEQYDVVKVTFDNVGLTPGDTYWTFIGKQDRLMHKWEYVLQGQQPPPTVAWWKKWQTFNGNQLALDRQFENRPVRIYFEDVILSPDVPEGIFESTNKTF